jgi:uncharacterized protein YndB with AHSA1/START domain
MLMRVKTYVSGWTVVKEVITTATPSAVFGALTMPRHLNKWFTQKARVDLRVGGNYSNLDGDKGRFLQVIPNERLRFTWDNPYHSPNSIVEIVLKRLRGQTIITLIHSGFKRETEFKDYSSKTSGWNWALENLKGYLEGRKILSFEEWLKRTRS